MPADGDDLACLVAGAGRNIGGGTRNIFLDETGGGIGSEDHHVLKHNAGSESGFKTTHSARSLS
jgi:hypothetical protein